MSALKIPVFRASRFAAWLMPIAGVAATMAERRRQQNADNYRRNRNRILRRARDRARGSRA